jgi:hypothetical protein
MKKEIDNFLGSVIHDTEYSLLDIVIAVNHLVYRTDLGFRYLYYRWFDEKSCQKLITY